MQINTRQISVAILFLILAACTPVQIKPNLEPVLTIDSSTLVPHLTSSTEPTKAPTIIPSSTPEQQSTSTSEFTPTPVPPLPGEISQEMRFAYLKMFNANMGWAIYSSPFVRPQISQVLRTANGIRAWANVTPPIDKNNSIIRTAYFFDENSAIVVSTDSHLPQSTVVNIFFWRTSNGGQTWEAGDALQIDQAADFFPSQLAFVDKKRGWMLAESNAGMGNRPIHIFETQDGGLRWEKKYNSIEHISDQYTLWARGYYPYQVQFAFTSINTGFFSNGVSFTSQDQGVSWILQTLPSPNDLPDSVCTTGNCKYLDTASVPQFTSGQDGVLTRQFYLNSETALSVYTHYPNATTRMPFPAAQYLYYTHDGGQTWAIKPSPAKIGTIFLKDIQTGWLLGKNESNPLSLTTLYHTKDGGETWTQIAGECPFPLGSTIQFLDDQVGIAYSPIAVVDFYRDFDIRLQTGIQNSFLFVTYDGGKSWVEVAPQIAP